MEGITLNSNGGNKIKTVEFSTCLDGDVQVEIDDRDENMVAYLKPEDVVRLRDFLNTLLK